MRRKKLLYYFFFLNQMFYIPMTKIIFVNRKNIYLIYKRRNSAYFSDNTNNIYNIIHVLPLHNKVILQCNSIFWVLLA